MGEIKEECGIAAVYLKEGASKDKLPYYLYKLLLCMQGRGQLSAGITTYDSEKNRLLDTHRQLGTVNETFKIRHRAESQKIFDRFKGTCGIGHVRYATSGKDDRGYAQPFERKHGRKWKWFSFCFNGNIANYSRLKRHLMEKGDYHIIYDTDTEIIMHHISKNLQTEKKADLKKVFSKISKAFDGAYSLAFINARGEIAVVRDPIGFKPLCYGETADAYLVASESNALDNCGVKEVKFVQPGQMVIFNDSMDIVQYASSDKRARCFFEWVYFSNVSSVFDEKSVYVRRRKLGRRLAQMETQKIDNGTIVVPVPDTAKPAGDAFAFKLGLPSEEGLIRNRYVGRTFIESHSRADRVREKFAVLTNVTKGKKILLIDDSIVRGTTSKKLVQYLKEVGQAKEVHLRVSCPPIVAPCFYGIDMSTIGELFAPKFIKDLSRDASKEELEKMAAAIDADSLVYMTKEKLVEAIGLPEQELCTACITGRYPTKHGRLLYKQAKSNKGSGKRTYE